MPGEQKMTDQETQIARGASAALQGRPETDALLARPPAGGRAVQGRYPHTHPKAGDIWMIEPIPGSFADWPARIEVLDVSRIKVAFEVTRPEHQTMRLIFRRPRWRELVGSERAYFIEAASMTERTGWLAGAQAEKKNKSRPKITHI